MSIERKAAIVRYLLVAGLVALWEFLPRAGFVPELFLPPLRAGVPARPSADP